VILIMMIVVALIVAFARATVAHAKSNGVRVKAYYLALGTSLAYGQQPPDFNHGYPQQWFALLQSRGSRSLTNYGCPGETSTQMIRTINCSWVDPYDPAHPTLSSHDPYGNKSQLGAALDFIKAHPHQVSPVSIDMGANDLLPDIHVAPGISPTGFVCTFDPAQVRADEDTLDANLRQTILPDLVQALKNHGGQLTGDLVMMNYYYPFQNVCPDTLGLFQDLNARLAADAAFVAHEKHVSIPITNVFNAFGGAAVPNPNLCAYTWFCPQQGTFDPHATTLGYGVIARTFDRLVNSR
jgi:hypothetical protein